MTLWLVTQGEVNLTIHYGVNLSFVFFSFQKTEYELARYHWLGEPKCSPYLRISLNNAIVFMQKRHLIFGLRYTQVLFKWFSSVSHFIEYNNQTRRSKGDVPKIHLFY